jgi:hypothetical protein
MLDKEIKTRNQVIDELKKMVQVQEKAIALAQQRRVEMSEKRETLLQVEQLTRYKIENPTEVHPATLDRLNRIYQFQSDEEYTPQ